MPDVLKTVLIYTMFPVVAAIVGGVVATLRQPGPQLSSAVQHFAAGVVFAAVAAELLPDVFREHSPLGTVIGFVLGVGTMLVVKQLTAQGEPTDTAVAESPNALLAAVAVDVTIDGLLVGIGFVAGAREGVLITFALTLEILFLCLSVSATLGKAGIPRGRAIVIITLLALLVAVGAIVGATVLGTLTGFGLEIVLAFGVAALLYLVTEELLIEAHETPDTPILTATFFAGFLVLIIIEMFTM